MSARAILADKRGLGKTLTSLLWSQGSRRLLVLAPKEVAENFLEEIELADVAPARNSYNLIGRPSHEREVILKICALQNSFSVVVNLEAWRKDRGLIDALSDLRFDTVIIDEAHNIKETRTLGFRGTRDIVYTTNLCSICGSSKIVEIAKAGYFCGTCGQVNDGTSSVKNVLSITGTPILNKPAELFPLLHLIDPVRWPNIKWFQKNYCIKINGRWRFRFGAENIILRWLQERNAYMARTREDAGIILPPQTPHYKKLDFNKSDYPRQWEIYEQLKEYAAVKINELETVDIVSILGLITRMRQAIVWPAGIEIPIRDAWGNIIGTWKCDVDESVKLDAAEEELLEARENGEKAVAYSQFREPLFELQRRLGPKSVAFVGGLPDAKRKAIRHCFDRRYNEGDWDILLCNYKVGGESLNFNACTSGVAVDRQWNYGREDQAMGRLDRLGQIEETSMYIYSAIPSIDEWMDDLIDGKRGMNEDFDKAFQALREYLNS